MVVDTGSTVKRGTNPCEFDHMMVGMDCVVVMVPMMVVEANVSIDHIHSNHRHLHHPSQYYHHAIFTYVYDLCGNYAGCQSVTVN